MRGFRRGEWMLHDGVTIFIDHRHLEHISLPNRAGGWAVVDDGIAAAALADLSGEVSTLNLTHTGR